VVKKIIPGRPLLGRLQNRFRDHDTEPNCTKDDVLEQLQTAVQLEWATLPAYLTALYSIVEGCNVQIYNIIRSIVMQEMLHVTQAANIMIALDRYPVMDDASFIPTYPTHLPGGVLPRLVVHLKKLSLEHVHRNFMAIEVPQETEVAGTINTTLYTIGVFYQEIADCIEELGDEIFNPSTVDQQVNWPWDPTEEIGYVIPVIDAVSAVEAIDAIIAQGEGAGQIDPTDIGNYTLAHFFKFEEIVCQNHLEQVSDDTYAYTGAPIPFVNGGVWPMRDNPTVSDITTGTNCYTEARVFHTLYRSLIRKLQEVFSGSPEEISEAVTIMESLQAHAKKLMWTKFYPDSDTTCGPVWDYEWPEETGN